MKAKIIATFILIILLPIIYVACNRGGSSTPSSNDIVTGTYFQVAQSGERVYSTYCASCHGSNGEGKIGPALIGNTNIPQKYPTAQQLLNKITNTMPQNNPGGLRLAQYQQVLSYILAGNNWVSPQDIFNLDDLGQVTID